MSAFDIAGLLVSGFILVRILVDAWVNAFTPGHKPPVVSLVICLGWFTFCLARLLGARL